MARSALAPVDMKLSPEVREAPDALPFPAYKPKVRQRSL